MDGVNLWLFLIRHVSTLFPNVSMIMFWVLHGVMWTRVLCFWWEGGGGLLSLSSSRSDNTQHSGVSLQGNECCFYFPHALFIINKAKVIFVTVGFSAATYINQGYNELFGWCFHLFFFGPAHNWEKIFYNQVYSFVFWLINSWNQVAFTPLVAVFFSDEHNSSRQRASALATLRSNGSTMGNLQICANFLCSWVSSCSGSFCEASRVTFWYVFTLTFNLTLTF